eukprot:s4226_g4.t1
MAQLGRTTKHSPHGFCNRICVRSICPVLQNLNIQCEVVPPDAHWQCGRIERHGGILQAMLSKYELEHDVSSYPQLQQALTQCIMAKNSCSLRHGYAPDTDTLVFGKGLRIPASITSDDSLPAHAIADSENDTGLRFRELLAMRETARRAFHAADNDMALRRAALRRDRPHRGAYEEGEWVMVWKVQNQKGSWVGPARVFKQDGNSTVFCNNTGSILKAAPEHVRPVSAVEARLIPIAMPSIPSLEHSHNSNQNVNNTEIPIAPQPPSDQLQMPVIEPQQSSSQSTSDQVDPEPEEMPSSPNNPDNDNHNLQYTNNPEDHRELQPHEIPIPDDASDELMCDLLTCTDEQPPMMPDGDGFVWRAELEFSQSQLDAVCQTSSQPTEEEFLFLATSSKKQRTEVKLSTLDPSERLEFEKAKSRGPKLAPNWNGGKCWGFQQATSRCNPQAPLFQRTMATSVA